MVDCRDWLFRIYLYFFNLDGLFGFFRFIMRVFGRCCVGAGYGFIVVEVEFLFRVEMGFIVCFGKVDSVRIKLFFLVFVF